MKTLSYLFLLLGLTISSALQAQLVRDRPVDESTVKPWIETDIEKYADRYIFQPNDGNFLIIIVDDTSVAVQIHEPVFWMGFGMAVESGITPSQIDSAEFKHHSEYFPLSNVRIENGKFYSDQYRGEFVTFGNKKTWQGIKIYNSWNLYRWKSDSFTYEIGVKRGEKLSDYMGGDYTEASTQILDSAYLSKFDKKELRVMRNEIFARYRYRFTEGGEMAEYFNKQDWYAKDVRRYSDVSPMLTWIELKNIELIKYMESLR